MTVIYDPQSTLFRVLLKSKGTILPLVIAKPTYWMLQIAQAILIMYDHNLMELCKEQGIKHLVYEHGCRLPPLDWSVVQLPASLLVFFVVFYGGNCYSRFYELWTHCTGLVNLTIEWAARLDIVFPGKENRELKWQAARLYMSGLTILFNMLGGDVTTDDPFKGHGIDEHEYEELQRLHLLTSDEVGALRNYYGVKPLIVVKWALATIQDHMDIIAPLRDRDDTMATYGDRFEGLAIDFQKRCVTIIMLIQQPVPFAYFHILKVQTLIVLLLIGYSVSSVFDEWFFASVAFGVICFVLLGLQEIAVAMADPFGDDDMDFETRQLLETTYINVLSYLREDFQVRSVSHVRHVPPNGLVNPLLLEGQSASQLFCEALFDSAKEEEAKEEPPPAFSKSQATRWNRNRSRRPRPPASDDLSYLAA